jgi:hypothetical protein
MNRAFAIFTGIAAGSTCSSALAWGNQGHQAIALIARHYIDQSPTLAAKIDSILAGQNDPDVGSNFDVLATWADRYRESSKARYDETHNWHFVDTELDAPTDKTTPCFSSALPPETAAYPGIPNDCVVNKINQFERELRDPATNSAERKFALLFLLHFVGDIHQPLHAADNHDRGGNEVYVVTGNAKTGTNLHSYWDNNAVKALGSTPAKVANALTGGIKSSDISAWTSTTAGDPTWGWADESFAIATQAYAKLPKKTRSCMIKTSRDKPAVQETCVVISSSYAKWAKGQAHTQIQKAGVRLAAVIQEALQ